MIDDLAAGFTVILALMLVCLVGAVAYELVTFGDEPPVIFEGRYK